MMTYEEVEEALKVESARTGIAVDSLRALMSVYSYRPSELSARAKVTFPITPEDAKYLSSKGLI